MLLILGLCSALRSMLKVQANNIVSTHTHPQNSPTSPCPRIDPIAMVVAM